MAIGLNKFDKCDWHRRQEETFILAQLLSEEEQNVFWYLTIITMETGH